MRKLFIYYGLFSIFLLSYFTTIAYEKYFVLRNGDTKYEVKAYTLFTDSLYAVHKQVELFNIYPVQVQQSPRDQNRIVEYIFVFCTARFDYR